MQTSQKWYSYLTSILFNKVCHIYCINCKCICIHNIHTYNYELLILLQSANLIFAYKMNHFKIQNCTQILHKYSTQI